MGSEGEGGPGKDIVSCIPEMLWCYPRAPAVQELELFVFPKQVPVRLERDDTWRALMQEQTKAQKEETMSPSSKVPQKRPSRETILKNPEKRAQKSPSSKENMSLSSTVLCVVS